MCLFFCSSLEHFRSPHPYACCLGACFLGTPKNLRGRLLLQAHPARVLPCGWRMLLDPPGEEYTPPSCLSRNCYHHRAEGSPAHLLNSQKLEPLPGRTLRKNEVFLLQGTRRHRTTSTYIQDLRETAVWVWFRAVHTLLQKKSYY